MKKAKDYFLGLDIGTDSVGYAVTDSSYSLLKFNGEPVWGVHLFEEASLNNERRAFRAARRRLDRRQQRVALIQQLFVNEIAKIDKNFFIRIKESALYPEDSRYGASLFNDRDFNDSDYSEKYPTIHHLIYDLISDKDPHDVRLVYLACAWLVAHRGHFLSEVSKENVLALLEIEHVYDDFIGYFGDELPWHLDDVKAFGDALKEQVGITQKYKNISTLLFGSPKPPKKQGGYGIDAMLKLLCGGKASVKDLFDNEEYADIESFTLDKSDDELASILGALGDDAELIIRLKALFDWSVLSDVLKGEKYISKAKISVYNEHKTDLKDLKYIIRHYCPSKYNEMFRAENGKKINYSMYVNGDSSKQEEFCKYVKSIIDKVSPKDCDKACFERISERADAHILCPKQVNSDNRVIPYQVYWAELKDLLDNASEYLDFLNEKEDGLSVKDKILSVFEFRVPYYVGPLNASSDRAWIKRKAEGKIYPWNFEKLVDLEGSEDAFIDNMTNTCTYIPGADVLPKMSLCYEKFQVLNEINTLSVEGRRIPVQLKQKLYNELFMTRKRVTKKMIAEFLRVNGYPQDVTDTIGGVDDNIKSSLFSHRAFERLVSSSLLTESDVENIIRRRTYTESKYRFSRWLDDNYPTLVADDRKYICSLKFKDFGRLSYDLLCGISGACKKDGTGEAKTVLERMWDENVNLMELLSDDYTYSEYIESLKNEYYGNQSHTLAERLDSMYVSNSVKRPIIRTFDIIDDIVKASGTAPKKIFIEMARGGSAEQKGKRTDSRLAQIQSLYKKCDTEDVRELSAQLEQMGDTAENRLQSERLFLYFMQLGRCMYTGKPIDLSQLSGKLYDVDHIYPRSKVKDDSVINNKVLVLSTVNAEKSNNYPIDSKIRSLMSGFWKNLKDIGCISEEKYKRLTRSHPFDESEQWGFINRQLVETRQSTKAIAQLLKERFPKSDIVYVKAGLVSEFRQEFDLLKTRSVNDFHHAKDAYLNIVVGNVYNERFTKKWFLANRDSYNIKFEVLFTNPVKLSDNSVVWDGKPQLTKVINVVRNKNAIHLTRYAFCRKGGFFDQNPVPAADGLVSLKKGMPTEKYGGYNKTTATCFMLAKYTSDKKSDTMLVPIELLYADKVFSNAEFAKEYVRDEISKISGAQVVSVEFPLGLRKIKIGTVFELDGALRMYLAGKSSGGRQVGFSVITQLTVGYEWEKYIKRLERFVEKKKENPKLIYSEKYDEINCEKNVELYRLLCNKLNTRVYIKRPANPRKVLIDGEEKFTALDVFGQAKLLMQVIIAFGRIGKCDLSAVGGSPNSGLCLLSSSVSNWKKNYKDVRIIDRSPSGLFEHVSANLLEI